MKNQFFYKRAVTIPGEEGKPVTEITVDDSFNVDMILRSFQGQDKLTVVVLDDLHDRIDEVPVHNKQGKITGVKNKTVVYQSEIRLNAKDTKRFKLLTEIKLDK